MHYPPINWLAVFVVAIVIFVLGGLWYSPALFAKRWIALQGKTEEQMRAEAASANMPLLYVGAFVTSLLIAITLALILGHQAAVVHRYRLQSCVFRGGGNHSRGMEIAKSSSRH